jgi:hypothetical protein
MMVEIPHDIPGNNCNEKLVHALEYGSGLEYRRSAQLMPFWHILAMCLVPCDAGLNHIPSINDAIVGGNVGIGAEVPSRSGIVMCDGSNGPSSCGMDDAEARRLPIEPINGLPLEKL